MLSSRKWGKFAAYKLTMDRAGGVEGRHILAATRPSMIVCLAISSLCGCAPHLYKNWSGDAIAFGNIKVITNDGEDFTSFCKGDMLATDDYVPGQPYSSRGENRDHYVYIRRFDSSGSYFAAAAPNDSTHLYLNCKKILANSITMETDYHLHVDIGTFKTPEQRAASCFGHLTVHLENDGKVTIKLDKDDDAHLEKIPLPVVELHLPLVRMPLASIGEPTGWSSSTSSSTKTLVP